MPKSVLHIANFVHFCEAFLRIEPHFELFRSLYKLVPLPSADKIGSIGCANLQLPSEILDRYIKFPRIHVDPDWKKDWFYIGNPPPSLPKFSSEPPEYFREWINKNFPGSADQVKELQDLVFCLREREESNGSICCIQLDYAQNSAFATVKEFWLSV